MMWELSVGYFVGGILCLPDLVIGFRCHACRKAERAIYHSFYGWSQAA
jgi:hypothetical protein